MRIGLTGGIGSGKSTVAAMLVDHGAALIDTDAIARSLALPGGVAMPAIELEFGPNFVAQDGGLDRAKMRGLVFNDVGAKRRLEAILHPLIGAECERQARAATDRLTVFDVPLLVESKRWRPIVDRVLVIDASEATQMRRVAARPGWTATAAQAVIAQQAERALRRKAADALIFNDGLSLTDLSTQVAHLWEMWSGSRAR